MFNELKIKTYAVIDLPLKKNLIKNLSKPRKIKNKNKKFIMKCKMNLINIYFC